LLTRGTIHALTFDHPASDWQARVNSNVGKGSPSPRRNDKTASGRVAHSWAADTGPGLATAGADNDPGGIVTYSLAGTQFGYDLLWVCILSYPSMVALQLVSSRVAAITGKGLTTNMREHYAPLWFYVAVARFLVANTVNIAADMVAMGFAARLLWNGSVPLFTLLLGAGSIALQWKVPYARYANVVKWLTLGMFGYVGVLFTLHVPWREVAWHALIPRVSFTEEYFSILLAVLGTTVSPYLLFAQAEQEIEELQDRRPKDDSGGDKDKTERHLRRVRAQTLVRTALSNAVGFFVMLAASATLHVAGSRLDTAEDVARVLQPLLHGSAPYVLGLALIGTALLALPPLTGSAANAAASMFRWRRGQERDRRIALTQAGLTTLCALSGVSLALLQLNFVKLLYWSALLNGMTVAPVLILLLLLSTKRAAIGDLSMHWSLRALCWLATLVTSGALTAHFVLEVM
jgi:NRAMP (natural resistance-associated macrophage protein)-like metal ion transporter